MDHLAFLLVPTRMVLAAQTILIMIPFLQQQIGIEKPTILFYP